MRILLRHLPGAGQLGDKKEYVDLEGVPSVGDEIHWADRILSVSKTIWFPGPNKHGPVACLYVRAL